VARLPARLHLRELSVRHQSAPKRFSKSVDLQFDGKPMLDDETA
jgi:hypothetical protein